MLKWILCLLLPMTLLAQSDSKMLRSSNTIPDGRVIISDNAYGPRYMRDSGLPYSSLTNNLNNGSNSWTLLQANTGNWNRINGAAFIQSNQVFTGVNGFSNAVDIYSQSWPATNSYAYRLFTYDVQSSSFSTNDIGTNVNLLLHANGTNASTWFPDSSTNNACTIVANGGTHVTNVFKLGDGSAYFDGTGDYLSCTNQVEWDFRTGDWSVEFWMKPDGAQVAFFGLVGAINNANTGWSIASRDGNMKPDFYFSGWKLAGAGAIPLNVWTHLAYARIGNTLKVFTNGVVDGTLDVTGYDFNSSQTLTIGRFYNNTDDYYFKGNLDEIIISKGVSRYTNSFTPPTVELGVGATTTNHSYYLYAIGPDGLTNQLAPSTGGSVDSYARSTAEYASNSVVVLQGLTSGWNTAILNSTSWTNWWTTNTLQTQITSLTAFTNSPYLQAVAIGNAQTLTNTFTVLTNGFPAGYGRSLDFVDGITVTNHGGLDPQCWHISINSNSTNGFVATNDTRMLMWTNADVRVRDSRTGTNANSPIMFGDWSNAGEPMGFPDYQSASWTQSFNNTSRIFSNILLTTSADYYFGGFKRTFTASDTVTVSAVAGIHYLYYTNSFGPLYDSTTTWGFSNAVQCAIVYWNGSEGLLFKENHGTAMDWATHRQMHISEGSQYGSGYTGAFSVAGMQVGAGTFLDEDILHTSSAMNYCKVLYHTNSSLISWTTNQYTAYMTSGGADNLLYDTGSTTSTVPAGSYAAYFVCAINAANPAETLVSIMGQRVDSSLANAVANNTYSTLNQTAMPTPEIKPLYRVIYHRANGTGTLLYDQTDDLRVDSLVTLTTGASGIPDAPSDTNKYARQSNTWVVVNEGGGSQTNVFGVEYANNAGALTGFSVSAYTTVSNNSLIGLTNQPGNWATVSNNTAIVAASSNNWNIGVTNQPPDWVNVSNKATTVYPAFDIMLGTNVYSSSSAYSLYYVPFTNKIIDTENQYNTTTFLYTFTQTGIWYLGYSVIEGGAGSLDGFNSALQLLTNGVSWKNVASFSGVANSGGNAGTVGSSYVNIDRAGVTATVWHQAQNTGTRILANQSRIFGRKLP